MSRAGIRPDPASLPAALPAAIDAATARALARGVLRPLETAAEIVEDGGVRFVVRRVSSLAHEVAARAGAPTRPDFDPFGPWEPDLFVADLSRTHVALLNKFPVLARHALLVTRDFADQEAPLDAADLGALALGLVAIDGLGFYNGGTRAGASQRHKHLQLVPLPLGEPPVPIEAAFGALPFAHALAPLEPEALAGEGAGARLLSAYEALRAALRLAPGDPYNLLVTRRWMLLVPRACDSAEGISVNALGFAGSLVVQDAAHADRLRAVGPMALLRAVSALPREPVR